MYKLFLTCRYLLRKWIAVFAVLSVWLCVAMVLIVYSVMDGFLDNIKQHSRGLLSDIVIDNATIQGFPYYEEFTAYLKQHQPEVALVTPVIFNYGILRVVENDSTYTKPVCVMGVRLEEYKQVNSFASSLYYDKYYPGTTDFAPKGMPLAGIDDADKATLPPDHVAAFAKYKAERATPAELSRLAPMASMMRGYAAPDGVGMFELNYGPPTYEGEDRPGVIIGTDLLFEHGENGDYKRVVPRGAKVVLTLLPLTIKGNIAESTVPQGMRYVDDSRTRVYEIDKMNVYIDFDLAQKLLSMGPLQRTDGTTTPPRANQLLARLRSGSDERAVRDSIEKQWENFCFSIRDKATQEEAYLLSGVHAETWEERQHAYIRAVEKERGLVTILFGIISLVSIVLIGVIFHMIVLQKTRDIGILKSLGASRSGVAAIFLIYGAVVGVLGGVLGTVTGSIFVHYINDIQDLLARMNPNLRVWSPDVYTFDRIPDVVKPFTILWVFAMAVVTSILGALWPALKAATVWPVKALRYE